jgi:plasmid maintenance system antidote protein VapI
VFERNIDQMNENLVDCDRYIVYSQVIANEIAFNKRGGDRVYSNLRVEMIEKNVTVTDIAKTLNKRRSTVGDKINGKYRIYVDEAFAIRDAFFPGSSIDYLFEASEQLGDKDLEVNQDGSQQYA